MRLIIDLILLFVLFLIIPQDGQTPLHAAAEKDNIKVVRLLLENKANINAPTKVSKIDVIFGCFGDSSSIFYFIVYFI